MKVFITAFLATLATASPILFEKPTSVDVAERDLAERQSVGTTAKEFTLSGCRDIIFIFARGSTEIGNLGQSVGPATANGLKNTFGSTRVAAEGVDYAAMLATNFLPGGADLAGIAEMKRLLSSAASRCPSAKIVAGGYSQGAALTHRAVEDLSASVRNRIVGIVTYGDTQNLQDGGRIRNYPPEGTKVICNIGDAVCAGTLLILPAHLDYVKRVPEALSFLAGRINTL